MASNYVVDANSIDSDRLKLALQDPTGFAAGHADHAWYVLLLKLPQALRKALLEEIEAGNRVTSIQFCGWPQPGSVLVSLAGPFKQDYTVGSHGVEYRALNDPHYWMADIHEVVDGVEHLIVT